MNLVESGLIFTFDRPILGEFVKRATRQAVEVWLRIGQPADTVRALRGSAFADDTRLTWTADPDDAGLIREFASQLGGRIVIDLNCDVVLDEAGEPVSSCWTSVFANHLPRPGGIMRTWIQIQQG